MGNRSEAKRQKAIYYQGYYARAGGKRLRDNPYQGAESRNSWERGWRAYKPFIPKLKPVKWRD